MFCLYPVSSPVLGRQGTNPRSALRPGVGGVSSRHSQGPILAQEMEISEDEHAHPMAAVTLMEHPPWLCLVSWVDGPVLPILQMKVVQDDSILVPQLVV